jgi:ATP-dependent DNA helicase RecG
VPRRPRRWPTISSCTQPATCSTTSPRRYDERGEHTDLRALAVGEQATVMAQVKHVNVRPMRARRGTLLEVVVGDGTGGVVTLTFFNQAWRQRDLRVGRWGLFAGKVTDFRGRRQLNGPDYVLLSDDAEANEEEVEEFAGALIPVYPAAAAVPTWTIARSVRVVLDTFEPPPDPLPSGLRAERNLAGLGVALRDIHRPGTREALHAARRRLKWDEAFAVQLTLVQRKVRAARTPAVPRPRRDDALLAAFDSTLPYELTAGQHAVGEEIATDLGESYPMHRLLQGEVGSGKTLCAPPGDAAGRRRRRAGGDPGAPPRCSPRSTPAACATCSGRTAAPASSTARRRAPGWRWSPGRSVPPSRRAVTGEVANGEAGIVVGTHALLYEGVDFHDLGLIVVDEQHRFRRRAARRTAGQGRQAAARAGHDRDADPANRRDDRLRRPGDLHAHRVAARPARRSRRTWCRCRRSRRSWSGPGDGCARRSRRATRRTSSVRASATRRATKTPPAMPVHPATTRSAPRWPCSTSPRCCARTCCRTCASASCTGAFPPTRRTP